MIEIYNPETDGINHINMYSKGQTELGRLLSNFANTPFIYEHYGRFESVEGFWYYYFSGCKHDILRGLSGPSAKKIGKTFIKDEYAVSDDDKDIILEAIRCKLRQNKYILNLLVKNDLPIVHYYAYDRENDNHKIIIKNEYDWMCNEIVRIRDLMIKDIINKKIKQHQDLT